MAKILMKRGQQVNLNALTLDEGELAVTYNNDKSAIALYGGAGSGKILVNPDRRTATFVVGSSAAGYTLSDADYLCDGTDDQAEINSAINALPSTGGKIVLLEGTYNISGQINMNKDNVTIEGLGVCTVLKRMGTNFDIIRINQKNHCTVRDLCIDGNHANYAGSGNEYSGQHGIGIELSQHCTVANVYIHDEYIGMADWGECHQTTFKNNVIKNCDAYGIALYLSQDSLVSDNYIDSVGIGIGMNWYCRRCMINNNHIINPSAMGIWTSDSIVNSIFEGNTVNKGNDTQNTIYMEGTYNIIANNQLPNMPYTDASGGTTNVFSNNV